MPAQRLTMRRVRELLRLHYGMGVSARAIARELGVSRSAVQDYLARATAAGLTWPLADDLTDGVLEERLFAASGAKPGCAGGRSRTGPHWCYSYSRFCELYRDFERRLSPTMRQHHVAGDKVFVDYSGKTIAIVERETGEVRPAQLFIAVLGASNYTYAAVSWTQALPDWISAHVQMFAFFQGCPRLVVPDNLKSGVHKPSFYDPEINRSYARMAAHYRVGILPARPHKPRDKAKVEAGVRVAQSYILGRLRHLTFFSLGECQTAVHEALRRMNERPMRRLGISRQALFAAIERPALQALPPTAYVYAEWRLARVGPDHHVEVDSFFYSVPHTLIREQVEVRITARAVEIGALNYKGIASILAHNLDRRPSAPTAEEAVIVHANVRGPRSFH